MINSKEDLKYYLQRDNTKFGSQYQGGGEKSYKKFVSQPRK